MDSNTKNNPINYLIMSIDVLQVIRWSWTAWFTPIIKTFFPLETQQWEDLHNLWDFQVPYTSAIIHDHFRDMLKSQSK